MNIISFLLFSLVNEESAINSENLRTLFKRMDKIENRFDTLMQEHKARANGGCITGEIS